MVDTSHQPAHGYMESSTNMMLSHFCHLFWPMLLMKIIHLDQWSAYQQVLGLPNIAAHETVNICWSGNWHTYSKHRVILGEGQKKMKGCYVSQIPSYLDEFMQREYFGQTKADSFMNIMVHISEQHPY